jgi:tRNA(Ile2)-agmatinylcytidine synthase
MQRAFTTTHDSYDEANRSATMVPASPCPVLFGIRGTEPADLPAALALVGPERPEGWLVFRTNQGTDDHLLPRLLAEARASEGVAVAGTVDAGPRTIEGGHVLLTVKEGRARLDLAAYEPTKGFRDVVRMLRPGDRVVACGSVRDGPRTLNLEKLKVVALGAPVERVKLANPKCPGCGKGMKSVGAGAGYRCARCGTKAPPGAARFEDRPRGIMPGWYEVPTCARRHLARPLKLGVRPEVDALA